MKNSDKVFMTLNFMILVIAMALMIHCDGIETRNLIKANHTEILTLMNEQYQADKEFLESLKKARANRGEVIK